MKKLLIGFVLLFSQINLMAQKSENLIQYVNPLIGTQKMGHTYPGASVPFGSVQLSPDTDQQPHNIGGKYNKDAYKYCASMTTRQSSGFRTRIFPARDIRT
jgi:putative alpha-1,2-mannosidase